MSVCENPNKKPKKGRLMKVRRMGIIQRAVQFLGNHTGIRSSQAKGKGVN